MTPIALKTIDLSLSKLVFIIYRLSMKYVSVVAYGAANMSDY